MNQKIKTGQLIKVETYLYPSEKKGAVVIYGRFSKREKLSPHSSEDSIFLLQKREGRTSPFELVINERIIKSVNVIENLIDN